MERTNKHYNIILRTMAIILEFLLYNIIYIILYSSALLIFINDCTFVIVVYFIASHITLNIIAINIVVSITRSKLKPVKKITILKLFYKSSLTIVAIIILILKDHWYLAIITIFIMILSVWWYHLKVRRYAYFKRLLPSTYFWSG